MSVRLLNKEAAQREQFRLICPDCRAEFLVTSPQAMIWEHCTHCRVHVWDVYDALLADRLAVDSAGVLHGTATNN